MHTCSKVEIVIYHAVLQLSFVHEITMTLYTVVGNCIVTY